MGGVALQYTLNEHLALAALSRMKNFDAQPVFEEIGAHLVSSTTQRFLDGASPEGVRWKPSQRVLASPGDKTLLDHAHLRDSITYRASGHQLLVGSNLSYSRIHQLGGDAGRGHSVHLPARPYLGLDPNDDDEIDLIVARHLRATMP